MRTLKVIVNGIPYEVEVGDLTASPIPVTVNGQPYTVELEGVKMSAPAATTPLAVAARPVTAPVQATTAPVKTAQPAAAGGAGEVRAPMPGLIVSVEVKVGDKISRGDTLCFLEAMKMKNAIRSPQDGVVAGVEVSGGQKVAHGDLLIRLQ